MDPTDSGQGQEKPSEQCYDLTPSSRGRQRKKNPKYFDYETDEIDDVQSSSQKSRRKSQQGEGAASQKTPTKSGKAKTATQQAADGEKEATDKTPPESVGHAAAETPKKPARAKKTPSKKTPAKKGRKKALASGGDLPAGEGGAADAVQQENGMPKPKRKYVRKQRVQEVEVVKEPPCEKDPEEPEEITPGGRRIRGAAKAALKYLHTLAKEVLGHPSDEPGSQQCADAEETSSERKTHKGNKGRKGHKRKRLDSDAAEDEDFVPDIEDEEAEEMEDEDEEEEEGVEESDLDSDPGTRGRTSGGFHVRRSNPSSCGKTPNGLSVNTMKVVWDFTETTKKFREEHYSSWVFPEWVPSTNDWDPVPQSDLEKYLPQELQSAAFRVSREGLKNEETPPQTLSRFEAVPAHPERWDMLLFAGGPVWALEWCPTPDGAPATQYVALACHRGMDNQHSFNRTYTEPGLVQLWDVGQLGYNSRPDSQPVLAYGLAQDKGFIWHVKWCPAGGWELPSCVRKAPFLPRLGLLAVATSSGVVTIYSLPHPDALHSSKKLTTSGKDSKKPPIYKAQGAVTLKLGSFKAPRHEMSGLALCMDWLPEKPHNIMAIGFYDGVVGLWDLSTRSALLRVRESDKSLSLLPYRCLLAHDHAVRALAFCPASRNLLVTSGEDRYVKTWDLRRLCSPVTVQKRCLANDVCWPLNAPGLLQAQDGAYVAKGSHGVHYFDHNMQSLLVIPRIGSLWSISYSEWLNSVVVSDSLGEVILSVLPQINCTPPYIKRTVERRFPIYFTSLVPCAATQEGNEVMGGAQEEEGDVVEEQEGGEREESDAAPEGGRDNDNEGGRQRQNRCPPVRFPTYNEAVRKYSLHHTDYDLRTFAESEKRAVWKRMKETEANRKITLDDVPLTALHKVRFNPNMSCHVWLVSAGQSGLVRLNCLRTMISSHVKKMISENQAQFDALYSEKNQRGPAVQTVTEQL